jgi:hypothetical protein
LVHSTTWLASRSSFTERFCRSASSRRKVDTCGEGVVAPW